MNTIDVNTDDKMLTVTSPLYVLRGRMACWKCGTAQSVVALSALALETEGQTYPDVGEPELLVLSYIEEMPKEVESHLAKEHPRYRRHFSITADQTYFANLCECGANFGDHYLTGVNGPFFPQDEATAAEVEIAKLPFEGPMVFRASFSQGTGDIIWRHGRRA